MQMQKNVKKSKKKSEKMQQGKKEIRDKKKDGSKWFKIFFGALGVDSSLSFQAYTASNSVRKMQKNAK